MRTACTHTRRARVAALLASHFLAACTASEGVAGAERVTSPQESTAVAKVAICHTPRALPTILNVAWQALPAHLAHGDYVTTLTVDQATTGADGLHYRRITDALDAARVGRLNRGELQSAACRITIAVPKGIFSGTSEPASPDVERFPLVVDVPDITLRGATVMAIDGWHRPTGAAVDSIETVLAPLAPLPPSGGASTPIVLANGHPDGSAGNGLIVEGFVFQSGPNPPTNGAGQGVFSIRVSRLAIRGNRFERGFTESIDLRASSADVEQNHLAGTAGSCDICFAAPGQYRAVSNRLLAGGVPGITTSAVVGLPLPAGVEAYPLPDSAEIWSEVLNNEVRDHLRTPAGVGIRVEALGTMAPNVRNTVHSLIEDNLIVNNRFGIMVHAGFPLAGTTLRGNTDVKLSGNFIKQSCQARLLVTFSRHQRTLGINSVLPYLLNSTFSLSLGGDVRWDDVWFGHPAGFGNALIVDGNEIANGIRHFYSATSCPGL